MLWLFFLLFHLIGIVSYNLILRKSLVDNMDHWSLATIMQTGIAIPMVFALFIAPPDLASYDVMTVIQIVVTSFLVVCLHATNVKALQYLEAGVYSVLYNLRIIFTTILGIVFLNESVVPLQILGGLLIFLAVLTVKQKGKKELTASGIKWGIAASIVISLLNLNEKDLINTIGYLDYAIPVMLLAAAIMWGVLLARKQTIKAEVFLRPSMLQLMGFRALSAYSATLAFNAGGLLSVTTYVSSLSVIIIVVLGALLLGENDYLKRKLFATGLAVLGLTAILIANL